MTVPCRRRRARVATPQDGRRPQLQIRVSTSGSFLNAIQRSLPARLQHSIRIPICLQTTLGPIPTYLVGT